MAEYEVIKISGGMEHSAAVTACGKLFTWGKNSDGRLLFKVEKYKRSNTVKSSLYPKEVEIKHDGERVKIVDVSCGEDHTLAIDSVGRLYSGGNDLNG